MRFFSVDAKGNHRTVSTHIEENEHNPLSQLPGGLRAIPFPSTTDPAEIDVTNWRLRINGTIDEPVGRNCTFSPRATRAATASNIPMCCSFDGGPGLRNAFPIAPRQRPTVHGLRSAGQAW